MKIIYGLFILLYMTGYGQPEIIIDKDKLAKEAVDTLIVLLQEQKEWVKVHAAEFLIWTGYPGQVKEMFRKEEQQFSDHCPYRIGIWRVLAQLSAEKERQGYEQEILNAFCDTSGKDRVHAAETLAKLKISPYASVASITKAALESGNVPLQGYTNWAIAYTSDSAMKNAQNYFYHNMVDSGADIALRRISAYVLRYIDPVSPSQWNDLAACILSLPADAEGRINFLTTAAIIASKESEKTTLYRSVVSALESHQSEKTKSTRMELANMLAAKGTKNDLPLLLQWLHNERPTGISADDADVKASAAFAILRVTGREK